MKILLKILFAIFFIWMIVGVYFLHTANENAQIVMGLGVFFFSFIVMPIFIYYRYRDGKYKKYILNDKKLKEAFGKQNDL